MEGRYLLRFDDVAPTMRWDSWEQVQALLTRTGIKPIMGVIPDNQDPKLIENLPGIGEPEFWDRVRRWRDAGFEIAMHGYQHRYLTAERGILRIGRKSEFAGLPHDAQLEKLRRGRAILEEQAVRPRMFMAPSHTFDQATLLALSEASFSLITDGFGFYPYTMGKLTFIPQRFATPWRFPFGVCTFCTHLNTMNAERLAKLLRFVEDHSARFVSVDEAVTVRAPVLFSGMLRFLSRLWGQYRAR